MVAWIVSTIGIHRNEECDMDRCNVKKEFFQRMGHEKMIKASDQKRNGTLDRGYCAVGRGDDAQTVLVAMN